MKPVPIIDLRSIDDDALSEIDAACRDHGFFLLIGHGLNDKIDAVLKLAEAFFTAPRSFKNSLRKSEGDAFGYTDCEVTKKKRDIKENFDYHGQDPLENTLGGNVKTNLWPTQKAEELVEYGLSDFESTLKDFYAEQTRLADIVMQLVCRAMQADAEELADIFGDAHMSAARLNYYPSDDPVPESERATLAQLGDLALGPHTDPNGITLLFQDSIGGLQARTRDGDWFDIQPVAHSFVVNIGDVMQAWSNDRYVAAQHRVKSVPKNTARISLPYFHMPKRGAIIKPIVKNQAPHYRAFIWDEFLNARLEDNSAVIERDDAQISDYRIEV